MTAGSHTGLAAPGAWDAALKDGLPAAHSATQRDRDVAWEAAIEAVFAIWPALRQALLVGAVSRLAAAGSLPKAMPEAGPICESTIGETSHKVDGGAAAFGGAGACTLEVLLGLNPSATQRWWVWAQYIERLVPTAPQV